MMSPAMPKMLMPRSWHPPLPGGGGCHAHAEGYHRTRRTNTFPTLARGSEAVLMLTLMLALSTRTATAYMSPMCCGDRW